MEQTKIVLGAYIDANILLMLALLLWLGTRLILNRAGLRHAYTAHLRLLNLVFAAVLLSPFLTLILSAVINRLMPGTSFNLADIAVAYYLNGNFAMKASDFETILGLRSKFTENLLVSSAPLWTGLRYLLLVGAAMAALRLGRNFWKLRQFIHGCYTWRRSGRVDLLLSDEITIPFSARGLRRFYIVIPSAMLTRPEELRLVLAHEFQHLRGGDVTWEIGLELLRPLVFWNPGFALWKRQIENLRELSCDQELTRHRGFDPRAYATCLLDVCERSLRNRRTFANLPAVALLTGEISARGSRSGKALAERITALIEARAGKSNTFMHHLLILPLVLVLALGALAIHKPSDWSHDRLMLSSIINLERLEARNTD
jgi:beta-lactamase regulating signal transducer with metallopeptidase domain